MNNSGELHRAFSEWRRLAEALGQGIRSGNWSFVSECQLALNHLRGSIDKLILASRPANLNLGPESRQTPFRSTVLELIELQRQNLAALELRRRRLTEHMEHLTRAGRNLRGIQRSYAPASDSAWSSYS